MILRYRAKLTLYIYAACVIVLVAAYPGYAVGSEGNDAMLPGIVKKVVDAYGGRDVINGIDSIYTEGMTHAIIFKDEGRYIRYSTRNQRLRTEITYSGRGTELRILNGSNGYRSSGGEPLYEAKGARYLSMLYQFKYIYLPYFLMKGHYDLSYVGTQTITGKNTDVIRLSDKDGPPMRAYVDIDSGYIIKVEAFLETARGATSLSAEFSDFREVGDTVMPFKIVNYGGGILIGNTVIEKYDLKKQMDDELFSPSGQGK